MSLISRMPPSTVVSERLGRCDPPPPAIILPPPASCGPCLTPPFLTVPLGSPLSLRGGLPWGGGRVQHRLKRTVKKVPLTSVLRPLN